MNPDRKVRADAKLKLLPQAAQDKLDDFLLQPGNTLAMARDYVRREWDITVSINTLSEWLAWYQARRVAAMRAAKIDGWIACEKLEHPELSDEELFRRGQRKFSMMAIAEELPDEWAKVQALGLEREKHAEKLKTSRERAMDALASEVKGNAAAEAAFATLLAALEGGRS